MTVPMSAHSGGDFQTQLRKCSSCPHGSLVLCPRCLQVILIYRCGWVGLSFIVRLPCECGLGGDAPRLYVNVACEGVSVKFTARTPITPTELSKYNDFKGDDR